MKTQKLKHVLAIVLLFAAFLSYNLVRANDNENRDNNVNNEDSRSEAHARGSTLEVRISDNGKVVVRGAKVTAVSGSTVNATTSWGAFNLNWQVNASSGVRFSRKSGGVGSISEISVGDIIGFEGMLSTSSSSPLVVNATVIKDWSVHKTHGSFSGTVKSVNSAGTS